MIQIKHNNITMIKGDTAYISVKYNGNYKYKEGNLIPEHKPYYSSVIFLGEQINTLEKAKELYVEEEA